MFMDLGMMRDVNELNITFEILLENYFITS